MNSSMWQLYWLTRVIDIHMLTGTLCILLIVCTLVSSLGIMIFSAEKSCSGAYIKKGFKTLFLFLGLPVLFTGLINTFTPDRNEAAFIIAGGAVVAAAQSDAGQKIAQKSVAILEGSLDTILGAEAVKKAQIDVEKKVVEAVKNQMGISEAASAASGK